ncbi:hypothetical protein [Kribbella sp. VKM Ac-2568]|nr:hypothetical protein [Kribbella sp. VKM Ac-2568]
MIDLTSGLLVGQPTDEVLRLLPHPARSPPLGITSVSPAVHLGA